MPLVHLLLTERGSSKILRPDEVSNRWTAQGPSYSAVNLYVNHLLYSNQPAGGVPLRLAQVRAVLFFNQLEFGPQASVRTFAGSLNGSALTCVLVARLFAGKPAAGGRRWDEEESCVDPKSGLLVTYSLVPGLYVLFEYSSALHFKDKILPGKFTIAEAGQPIIEARIESVSNPAKIDDSLFTPTGLSAIGTGSLMTQPWRMRSTVGFNPANANPALHVVVLHGMVSPDGHMSDSQVLASSNPSLNQSALDRAAQWQNWRSDDSAQPGATPQSHEVFFTFEFLSQ
jgi:hypothetical protein